MARMRKARPLAAALALGLALGVAPAAWAQRLQTGSGVGTGTGQEAGGGLGTTGTGAESGGGLGSTGTGNESNASSEGSLRTRGYGPVPRGMMDPGYRPGTRSPDDIMPPFDATGGRSSYGSELTGPELEALYDNLMARARLINQPGQRAMAYERIARSAIFTSRFDQAHTALVDARQSALQEPMTMVRDQRIMATITTLLILAEAQVREGMTEELIADEARHSPGRPFSDRRTWLQNAEGEWERAAELATRLNNKNFRTQILYQVVESQAGGSQMIANQLLRATLAKSNLMSQADPLSEAADRDLVLAAAHARLIERPVWRDRALVAVAVNAAASNQFKRGLEIARTVPQPEVRTDGLLHIAEAQARHNFNKEATATYREVAETVAAIPQQDPRTILTGVLIDSLVTVGRFDDARACVVNYPDYSNKIIALGAIAESQGSRGLADSARAWIAREGPPEYRPYLYRRVNDGILASVDRNRSNELTNRVPGAKP
jgi:hypothetical protein